VFKVSFNRRQGAYGWRLDPNVKAYSSYEQWEAPPDPENVQVGTRDLRAHSSSVVCSHHDRALQMPSHDAIYLNPDTSWMQLESVNVSAGREELEALGLAPPRHMEQRSMR
jgi:hypothetical protein